MSVEQARLLCNETCARMCPKSVGSSSTRIAQADKAGADERSFAEHHLGKQTPSRRAESQLLLPGEGRGEEATGYGES